MKMTTRIPPEIITPDRVETRIGALEFFDGIPTEATAGKVYDELDFARGIEAFLNGIPAASMVAIREGMRSVGAVDGTIGIFQDLMDSRSIFLTANTESIYCGTWIDLRKGPIVIESPPNVLGVVNDFWFRYVCDLGNAGPDRGQGGKYLILPPDHEGAVPEGYFSFKSPTFGNLVMGRGFMRDGSPQAAAQAIKGLMRVYSLSEADSPHAAKFVELSGREMNTVHANTLRFYEELDAVIQEEPEDPFGPDMMGLFNAIGLRKGRLFNPDSRSMLQTDQRFPSFSSERKPKVNADGSVDVIFSPARPAGDRNWVQTVPGKSWFTIFRLGAPGATVRQDLEIAGYRKRVRQLFRAPVAALAHSRGVDD